MAYESCSSVPGATDGLSGERAKPAVARPAEEVPHVERGKNGGHIRGINKYCSLEQGLKDLRSIEPV